MRKLKLYNTEIPITYDVISPSTDYEKKFNNQVYVSFNVQLNNKISDNDFLIVYFSDKQMNTGKYFIDSILIDSTQLDKNCFYRKKVFLVYIQNYFQVRKVNDTTIEVTFENDKALSQDITFNIKVVGIKF